MDEKNLYLESLKHRNYDMYKYFKRGLDMIATLKEKTYEAYIVGGVVRDFVLNVDFNDIDIATSATPAAIKDIFSSCNIDDYYESLGTIVIKEAGFRYEITTFRTEEYVKFKIKDVHYSKKLVEDIIRRDYTINALALTPNLTVVDLVEGQKDLENGIVRIIGSGKRRFKDDPTRILRGLHLVAKFGFDIESNTEKGMRKSKQYLKELSDQKMITLLYKILNEKFGLKALKAIDDNNLFKFLPNYSYWVRLLIKSYKKLGTIEKITLLYRIMGQIPDNTGHTHEELVEIKKLLELSQHLSVNKVNAMMVFKIKVEDLLAADRISKAYNHKYHSQKRKIKSIHKHLPIHHEKELDFSNRELISIVGSDDPKISMIRSELLSMVINGEVPNKNLLLRNEVMKLMSKSTLNKQAMITKAPDTDKKIFNPIFANKREKEDKYFDDAKEEEKLYQKVYDDYSETLENNFDAWDQVPVDIDYYEKLGGLSSNNKLVDISDEELKMIKDEYKEDFMQLYKIYVKGVKNYYELSEREQKIKSEEIKQQVKEFLLRNNTKYRVLNERGLV